MYKTTLSQSWMLQVYTYKSMYITVGIIQVDITLLSASSTCVSMTTKWIPSNLVKPQSTMSCVKVVFELNEISVQLI